MWRMVKFTIYLLKFACSIKTFMAASVNVFWQINITVVFILSAIKTMKQNFIEIQRKYL